MSTRKEFIQKIAKIQKEIKCNKSQFNKFGNFFHRNIEDVMEAVKPFLGELMLKVSDEMVMIGERIYVKSTATITDGEHEEFTVAFAREPESAKGLSDGQISGAASSYASKYSLGKLLLLDDNKDADSNEATKLSGKEDKAPSDKPSRFARKSNDKPKEGSTVEAKGNAPDPSQDSSSDVSDTKADQPQEAPSKTSFRRFKRG
jgi:hypothetical protein